jgi:hypothetical protein
MDNGRPLAMIPVYEAMARALAADRGEWRLELVFVDGELKKAYASQHWPKLTRSALDLVALEPRLEA